MSSTSILLNIPKVPPMTDPLSVAWDAPKVEDLTFSLSHVFMTAKQFGQLRNYQHTNPSGVYDGKMWRWRNRRGNWYLIYYKPGKDADHCSMGQFRIQII